MRIENKRTMLRQVDHFDSAVRIYWDRLGYIKRIYVSPFMETSADYYEKKLMLMLDI